ncbi:hypothetical protein PG994_013655 [Apiospora phragmitis]|uniref:Uncharacterized protein n=1 Tax=Apiospora phragmitis TaxID=2905665 RepID=A0ABR1T995_9PEZI
MHFRKPSEAKHHEDKAASSDMARRSVSLGTPGPTPFPPPKTATDISLPDSLGDFSSGISWDIPHLNDLDVRGSDFSEQGARSSALNQPPPSGTEGTGQAVKTDDEPLSNAIDIILARSRVYAPARRNEAQPWWTTRSAESTLAAERARRNLQDHLPPDGTELYFIYPKDGCSTQQTRSIDKHLEDSVDAYAMHRSNLFEGVLFWRAFLTASQLELIRAMPEVGKPSNEVP